MALTPAERSARWREKHILARRNAQRVANLLVGRQLGVAQIEELAVLLNLSLRTRENVRTLTRTLRRLTEARSSDVRSGVRLSLNKTIDATMDDEKNAWERDHPGEEYPEHECGLTGREYTDLWRWRRQRARRFMRATARS